MKKVIIIITAIVFTIGLQAQVNYQNNTVTGTNASSVGEDNTSSGAQSFSSGKECVSSGNQSTAFGKGSEASNFSAVALGAYNTASGYMSLALGSRAYGEQTGSVAIGNKVKSTASYSFAIGYGLTDYYLENNIPHSLMIGFKSNVPTFYVGPGNGNPNSLGKVGIGTTSPSKMLDVNGTLNVSQAATFGNSLTVSGKTTTAQLQITQGAAANKILQSDADGNASWVDPITVGVDDGDWIFNGNNIYRMGNVSIGTSDIPAKLTVDGDIFGRASLTVGGTYPGTYKFSVNANSTNWASVIKNSNTGGKGLLIKAGHTSYSDNPILQLADNDGAVKFTVKPNGDVNAINLNVSGTLTVDQNVEMSFLTVSDKIEAGMIEVKEISKWQDDVFKPEYNLRSLREIEQYIKQNGHLPEIPSEADVLENGYNMGEMDAMLLKKIEELTLYVIELEKMIKERDE